MRYIIGNKTVDVALPFGIHAAEDDSAIGKTYLAKLLQAGIAAGNMEYLVVTYR